MRERQFNIIVGAPGSGKSTFTANVCSKLPENVIIYKHIANIDDKAFSAFPIKTTDNWRQGAKPGHGVKCKIAGEESDYRPFLKWVKNNYRNGALVIDDCTIFERDRLTKEMNHLVSMRRHYGIDIYLIYHGLSLLPIEQFVFLNKLVIFNTTDNFQYKIKKIPNVENINHAVNQARLNRQKESTKYNPVIVVHNK